MKRRTTVKLERNFFELSRGINKSFKLIESAEGKVLSVQYSRQDLEPEYDKRDVLQPVSVFICLIFYEIPDHVHSTGL